MHTFTTAPNWRSPSTCPLINAALPPLAAAGDAYAAGLLYGYLAGADLVSMGRTAARVASAVISKHGAALSAEAAAALAESLPGASRRAAAPALAPSTP
jgi:hypothetical protein